MTNTPQVVPASLRTLLDRLAAAGLFHDFYLAGGTGLALLVNHRRSVDLDCFSRTNRLDAGGRAALQARLRGLSRWAVIEAKDGTLHGRIGRVRVSFFWYPEPLVKSLLHHGPIRMASLEDIGLMKIGAIIGRGSRKDFVDLYAICQHIPLPHLLRLSRHKFRDAQDFTLQALKALSYFEDAEREPSLITPASLAWDHVKAFFTHEVQTLTRAYLK